MGRAVQLRGDVKQELPHGLRAHSGVGRRLQRGGRRRRSPHQRAEPSRRQSAGAEAAGDVLPPEAHLVLAAEAEGGLSRQAAYINIYIYATPPLQARQDTAAGSAARVGCPGGQAGWCVGQSRSPNREAAMVARGCA